MEVSHYEDFNDHVVVGGEKAQAFSITQNAEFITALSDTLYPNKPLAVAREYLTNAWDAHVDAGITDTPVEITVSPSELIIRDFGSGIPHDQIVDIYCTYGESTKRNNSGATGGFGLGSKAAFAIATHFTVRNWHNSVHKTYVISRGSTETDGLPDIRCVVTTSTTQTGVEVRIPLKENQSATVEYYLRGLAFFGNIKITLNGEVYDSDLPLNQPKYDWVVFSRDIAQTHHSYWNQEDRVLIQYGRIVYPINWQAEYDQEYQAVLQALHVLNLKYPFILFKAEPGELAIVPSREDLSYSETCIKNIKQKLEAFLSKKSKNKPINYLRHLYKNTLLDDWKDKSTNMLAAQVTSKTISYEPASPSNPNTPFITTYPDLYVLSHRTFGAALGQNVRNEIFYSLLHKRLPRKFAPSKIEMSTRSYPNDRCDRINHVYHRNLIRAIGKENEKYLAYRWSGHKNAPRMIERFNFTPSHLSFVVHVARYAAAFRENIPHHAAYTRMLFPKSVTDKEIKDIVDRLKLFGYEVRDYLDFEPTQATSTQRTNSQTGRKKAGYALLRECLDSRFRVSPQLFANAQRTDSPDVVLPITTRHQQKRVSGFAEYQLPLLLEIFPNAVLVSNDSVMYNANRKHNLKHVNTSIDEWLSNVIGYSGFANDLKNYIQRLVDHRGVSNPTYQRWVADPDIAQYLPTHQNTYTFVDEDRIKLIMRVYTDLHYRSSHHIAQLYSTLEKDAENNRKKPSAEVLSQKLQNWLSSATINSHVDAGATQADHDKAKKLILACLT